MVREVPYIGLYAKIAQKQSKRWGAFCTWEMGPDSGVAFPAVVEKLDRARKGDCELLKSREMPGSSSGFGWCSNGATQGSAISINSSG